MSVRRPKLKKPNIPRIKKPSISKRKRVVKKISSLAKKNAQPKTSKVKHLTKKKTRHKIVLGTCYINKNCKGVLSRKVTKTHCKKIGGKSWKKIEGTCENL